MLSLDAEFRSLAVNLESYSAIQIQPQSLIYLPCLSLGSLGCVMSENDCEGNSFHVCVDMHIRVQCAVSTIQAGQPGTIPSKTF